MRSAMFSPLAQRAVHTAQSPHALALIAGAAFDNGAARAAKLAAKLERLQPGTYIMVDHCGTEDPEMRALGHFGYENMAADRAAVVEAWTSPKVLEVVKRRNIQLIGHADLPRLARQ